MPPVNQADVRAASRPHWSLLGVEPLRAALEYLRRARAHGRTQELPRGDGHPVVLFPGLGTTGLALAPLRAHCRALGYAAFDWGRGRNLGPRGEIDAWLAGLARDVTRLLAGHDGAPSLVGWSLGGLYARELARLIPVRQVITIGTPFNGHAGQTHAGWIYRLLNGQAARADARTHRRLRSAPPVPTTSIYSRSDGIVAWQTCRHVRAGAQVQDVEVDCAHLAMGWNARVLDIVADRLAQPVRGWQPYCDASLAREAGALARRAVAA